MPDTIKIDGDNYWISLDNSLVCENRLVPKSDVARILATSRDEKARVWERLVTLENKEDARKQRQKNLAIYK